MFQILFLPLAMRVLPLSIALVWRRAVAMVSGASKRFDADHTVKQLPEVGEMNEFGDKICKYRDVCYCGKIEDHVAPDESFFSRCKYDDAYLSHLASYPFCCMFVVHIHFSVFHNANDY
jgi:hypothetical protein